MTRFVSSGTLKSTIANALELPERRVEYPHRVVQEHGEVSKGKRGKGGAGVNTRDTAITLMAVANSFIGDEIISGVRSFSSMPLGHTAHITYSQDPDNSIGQLTSEKGWTEFDGGPWQLKDFHLPSLKKLPKRHKFIDAFTAIIDAARDDTFATALRRRTNHPLVSHSLRVRFGGPEPFAAITIEFNSLGWRYIEEAQYFYEQPTVSDGRRSAFSVSVEIDHQPIYAVAELFREPAK